MVSTSLGTLLGRVALLLAVGCRDCSSSSHSLRNFRLVVSEPSPGLPQFTAVGYVDDQPIFHYNSYTWRAVPVAPWMRKVEQDDPRFWEEESLALQGNEKLLVETLAMLQDHFHHNSSTGLHTLQLRFSCKVGLDGQPREGSWEYAYDGEGLLVLSMNNSTWTVLKPSAEILKQKLDSLLGNPPDCKHYLEEICVHWLQKYLGYRNETMQRTEPLMVRVAGKKGDDGQETLLCQLYGFYPKEVTVTWMKNGEEQEPDNRTGRAFPNWDGTYYMLLSVKVKPKERDFYWCRVGNNSFWVPLDQPRDVAAIVGLTVGVAIIILIAVLLGLVFCMKKQQRERRSVSAPRDSDKASACSTKGDSGRVSLCSGEGDSEGQSDSDSDGESSLVFYASEDGDSGQVSCHFKNRGSGQETVTNTLVKKTLLQEL